MPKRPEHVSELRIALATPHHREYIDNDMRAVFQRSPSSFAQIMNVLCFVAHGGGPSSSDERVGWVASINEWSSAGDPTWHLDQSWAGNGLTPALHSQRSDPSWLWCRGRWRESIVYCCPRTRHLPNPTGRAGGPTWYLDQSWAGDGWTPATHSQRSDPSRAMAEEGGPFVGIVCRRKLQP